MLTEQEDVAGPSAIQRLDRVRPIRLVARHHLWRRAAFAIIAAESAAWAQPVPQDHPPEASREPDPPAVDLSALYTFDIWSNLDGGLRRELRYLDNLDLTLTIDGERALGWRDATIYVHALYNNGERFSEDVIGDRQVVSNIETGVRAVRLFEAWVEQRLAGDKGSVKLGLYDLNSEFDATESGGLFVNSSHGIGPEFSQTGKAGPSIFPVTSLALRGEYAFDENWLARGAILDGVPGDPNRPARTAIRLGKGDGALAVGEIEYATARSKVALGYWRYTGRFEDLLETRRLGVPIERGGNDGAYALVEHRLIDEPERPGQGLSAWLRGGVADARLNPIEHYVGSGLVYTGIAAGRDEDQLGIALAWIGFGEPYRRAQRLAGTRTDRGELAVELTYRAALTPWLTIQPDVQYIVNPGGDPNIGNALATGLRVEIGFR